jgi:hypothetical protein
MYQVPEMFALGLNERIGQGTLSMDIPYHTLTATMDTTDFSYDS